MQKKNSYHTKSGSGIELKEKTEQECAQLKNQQDANYS